jgi:hypothetical protein
MILTAPQDLCNERKPFQLEFDMAPLNALYTLKNYCLWKKLSESGKDLKTPNAVNAFNWEKERAHRNQQLAIES